MILTNKQLRRIRDNNQMVVQPCKRTNDLLDTIAALKFGMQIHQGLYVATVALAVFAGFVGGVMVMLWRPFL